MSLGLALSGGGAKGMAHIGVLEALNDNNIKIDYISGTSSGSIIAAMYAAGYTPNEILKIFVKNTKNTRILDYDKKAPFKLINFMISKKINLNGFIKGNKIEKLIRDCMLDRGIKDISDIKMPLAIPIVNVKTGELVYYTSDKLRKFDENLLEIGIKESETKGNEIIGEKIYDDIPEYRYSGDIADIIRASISFPGVFKPKCIGNELYIDGGVRANTPVKILKQMGADKVISISFDCNKIGINSLKNVIGITSQAFDILTHEAVENETQKADINIKVCTKNVTLLDFSKSVFLAKKGYYLVNNNAQYIKNKLK